MALKTGMEGKPWYVGLGVGLGIGGLLFAVGYWRMLQPLRDDYDRAQNKLEDLQTKIQEGRAARQELPKFREEVRQLELELDKLLRILPARRNTPDLMRRIRSLAEQGDFALKRFNPGIFSDKEFYSEWPIGLNIEGTYHNLALFFDRISRFSRIINVETLEINAIPSNAKAEGNHTIGSSFTAKTFVYKEPEPETTEDEDGKGKGRDKDKDKDKKSAAGGGPASRIRSGGGGPAGGPD